MNKINLEFPKPIMTISELAKMGFSKSALLEYASIEGTSAFREGTGKTASWKIVAKDYQAHVNKINGYL